MGLVSQAIAVALKYLEWIFFKELKMYFPDQSRLKSGTPVASRRPSTRSGTKVFRSSSGQVLRSIFKTATTSSTSTSGTSCRTKRWPTSWSGSTRSGTRRGCGSSSRMPSAAVGRLPETGRCTNWSGASKFRWEKFRRPVWTSGGLWKNLTTRSVSCHDWLSQY